jgi:hypothetical protein
MNMHGKLARRGSTRAADMKRAQFIREIKNEVKQRMIEQKTWRELLEVDNLTINGTVLWKDGQLSGRYHLRHRK